MINFGQAKVILDCPGCGASVRNGFAKCRRCGRVRPEFEPYTTLISEVENRCIFTGSLTDLVLPNGDAVWAPYFLDLIEQGLLSESFEYTDLYYREVPG